MWLRLQKDYKFITDNYIGIHVEPAPGHLQLRKSKPVCASGKQKWPVWPGATGQVLSSEHYRRDMPHGSKKTNSWS